jgi:mannose-6-phosphate isomerase-like protein (cupin superfamily)
MESTAEYPEVRHGAGYAVGHLDDLGSGPGFRKVRRALDVSAFGVNAIVLPVGVETGFHYHDRQEELYFIHRGTVEMEFADGAVERLPAGSFARVDADAVRKLRNAGDGDAVYICVGGVGGYIGRDGRVPPGEEQRVHRIGEAGGGS